MFSYSLFLILYYNSCAIVRLDYVVTKVVSRM